MPTKPVLTGGKTSLAVKKSAAEKAPLTTDAADAQIDFPKEGQKIATGHYAVRITAPSGLDVEINTGGTEWWGCRESVGFFWFDWWPAKPGRTVLTVRLKSGKGRWKKASERACTVTVANSN